MLPAVPSKKCGQHPPLSEARSCLLLQKESTIIEDTLNNLQHFLPGLIEI